MSFNSSQPMVGPYLARSSAPLAATCALRETRTSSAVSWMGMVGWGRALRRDHGDDIVGAGFGNVLICLGESALEDRNGHAQEDGVAKHPEGPDPETDQRFVQGRGVFDDRAERRGDEAGDHQAHALLDPDAR